MKKNSVKCPINGCESFVEWNGMCGKHAQRVLRYGDPNHITSEDKRRISNRIAQPTFGKLKKTTYKKFLGRHEHRVEAEKKIGRNLKSGEIVHHIDGNKHNNSHDNLEILTQSEHLKLHFKEMLKRRIKKTHCPKGHSYSGENLRLTKNGAQVCKTCMRGHQAKWKQKNGT